MRRRRAEWQLSRTLLVRPWLSCRPRLHWDMCVYRLCYLFPRFPLPNFPVPRFQRPASGQRQRHAVYHTSSWRVVWQHTYGQLGACIKPDRSTSHWAQCSPVSQCGSRRLYLMWSCIRSRCFTTEMRRRAGVSGGHSSPPVGVFRLATFIHVSLLVSAAEHAGEN